MPKRPDMLAWLVLGFTVLVSSTNPIAMKVGLRDVGPLWMISIRLMVAALVMTVVLHGRVRLPTRAEWPRVAMMGLLGWTAVVTPITWAAAYVPAAVVGMSMAAAPLFALVVGMLLFGQRRPYRVQLLGLLIGFAGVGAVILLREQAAGGVGSSYGLLPYLALITATMIFSISVFVSSRATDIPGLTKGLGAMWSAGIAGTALALLLEPLPTSIAAESFASMAFLCIVATGLNGLAIFWLVDRVSPQFVALGNYLMPIGNILLAMALLGEVLAPGQYLGILVILAGMALSEWRPRPAVLAGDRASTGDARLG